MQQSNSSLPLVSIVITTKNEEHNIKSCLESIKLQTYQPIEIIVVDNNSTDQTKTIATQYTSQVFNKGPERSAQRNFGLMEKAQGHFAMFLDADMILVPDLVEKCVKTMQANDYVALHVSEIVLGKKFFSQVRRFERSFYDGTVVDGARFFKKSEFIRIKGFDESFTGPEDWDLDKKLKQVGSIGLVPVDPGQNNEQLATWPLLVFISEKGVNPKRLGTVIYHNESEFDLAKYINKKGYYANSMDSYITKWGAEDADIKKQLGLGYRFLGVFVEQGKVFKLLQHPFLTFGMYFLRFLVGFKYLLALASKNKKSPQPY